MMFRLRFQFQEKERREENTTHVLPVEVFTCILLIDASQYSRESPPLRERLAVLKPDIEKIYSMKVWSRNMRPAASRLRLEPASFAGEAQSGAVVLNRAKARLRKTQSEELSR